MDIFATRAMLAALEVIKPPRSFLLDTFFPAVETSDTEYVDIDIIKHKRRLAAFVTPLAEGKQVERLAFNTKTIKPAYIKEKMKTTAADLLVRPIGQNIYQTAAPEQRAALQLARDLQELRTRRLRRMEWMAASALNAGTIQVTGEGVDVLVDFGMGADHKVTLAGTAKWTDQAAGHSTPLENLRTWKRLISQSSGRQPNIAVFGYAVIDAFMAHPEVQAYLNQWRNLSVQVQMDSLPEGVTYVGRFEGLDIYGYDEWYLDDNDVEQPLVPGNKIFLGSTKARLVQHYGAIQDLDAGGLAALNEFPKSWRTTDPSVQWVMLQSAPLVVPHEIDTFMSIQPID